MKELRGARLARGSNRSVPFIRALAALAALAAACDGPALDADAGAPDGGPIARADAGTDAGEAAGPIGIVFSTGDGLGAAAADGSMARMLDEAGAASHVLSPDGTQVAYRGEGGFLYVAALAGGPRVQVSTRAVGQGLGFHEPLYYGWAADGSRLWYVDGPGGAVVAPDGSDEVVVPGRPHLSPDGARILYVAEGEQAGPRLWIMPADGSSVAVELSGPATDGTDPEVRWAAWSPDGTRIAYSQQRDAQGIHLYLVNPDGTNEARVTSSASSSSPSFEWAPDGSFLVYEHEGGIWRVDADGSGAAELAPSGYSPRFSPSGAYVAFIDSGLNVVAADGSSGPTLVGPHFEPLGSVDESWEVAYLWSPDEERIVYRAEVGLDSSLRSVRRDGTADVELHVGPVPLRSYRFLDDATLAWTSASSPGALDVAELFIGPADGASPPMRGTYDAGSLRIAGVSGDGERICVWQRFDGGLGGTDRLAVHLWAREGATWSGTEVVAGHETTTFMQCTLIP